MRSETARRDWLLIGLSLIASVVVFMAVDKALDFTADASPTAMTYLVDN